MNRIERIIRKVLSESVSFGEFGSDGMTWRAANLIYDNGHGGTTYGRLFGYLRGEFPKITDAVFAKKIKKLLDTGDYVVVKSPDKWQSKIYYKAFKP